jgi:riboflavin synthase
MFTGIVERRGTIAALRSLPGGGRRVEVELEEGAALRPWEPTRLGESIALDGVCLTVAALEGDRPCFEVVPETLGLTTLGALASGSRVNLERSLAVGDRLGGHFLTGHVDGTGTVVARDKEGDQVLFRVETSRELTRNMLLKGSIAVDGVSLTLVSVDRQACAFSFAAIPHTLSVTTLGERGPGSRVNLETDALGKWVLHGVEEWLARLSDAESAAWLERVRESGKRR